MKKFVIIGSSGAGKSTLASKLMVILDIKVFHLDRLFWKYGWEHKNRYDRMELLEQLAFGERRWIIEGNYLMSLESALKEADTIIFLDLPPLLCLWRIIKRHRESRGLPRCDIPEGCTDRFTIRHLLKTLAFPFRSRKMIEQMLQKCSSKYIIRLRSRKDVEYFLAQQERIENDEKGPYSSVFSIREEFAATKRRLSILSSRRDRSD